MPEQSNEISTAAIVSDPAIEAQRRAEAIEAAEAERAERERAATSALVVRHQVELQRARDLHWQGAQRIVNVAGALTVTFGAGALVGLIFCGLFGINNGQGETDGQHK